ncbi:MAG: hypothetical protein PUE51_06280 [Veillonellaceae bacterium]|nr:hypothetical protein [Veillonellaceae bacterium]MDD6697937.1 hypothetical protein [Veillonellaceae bacterium]
MKNEFHFQESFGILNGFAIADSVNILGNGADNRIDISSLLRADTPSISESNQDIFISPNDCTIYAWKLCGNCNSAIIIYLCDFPNHDFLWHFIFLTGFVSALAVGHPFQILDRNVPSGMSSVSAH